MKTKISETWTEKKNRRTRTLNNAQANNGNTGKKNENCQK